MNLETDILVVGGGTGGTAAAIQAARLGVKTILVSEFPWLGGMLTSAGVCAPDGNELAAFQTGIWGAFVRELQRRQPEGLDHAWVSFFTYDPRVGAQIFADWVQQLPNLKWIVGQTPQEVLKQGNCVIGIRFENLTIHAKLTLDGTELGDLLALGEIPHRWGWELQSEWGEPSAPTTHNDLTRRYPVQAPTWVVLLQDFGAGGSAPVIPTLPHADLEQFVGAWDGYSPEEFLNYGRLPGDLLMLNWPQQGNDYGSGLTRLVESKPARLKFFQEAHGHSQNFARFIQAQLGHCYGLASGVFPLFQGAIGGGAYALHPYYRESRRLQGLVTIKEQDILPTGGQVAPLPNNSAGQMEAVAIANYVNDHHYPGSELALKPKSLRWGGRWTGTPFTIPYSALIPAQTDGFLACEKNISVSHITNGATRLQPVVLGIGQAAGMAAALCVQRCCQPRDLPVRVLQDALLSDAITPAAIVPLFNLTASDPDWLHWQRYYLDHPETYPASGNCPSLNYLTAPGQAEEKLAQLTGTFRRQGDQNYTLTQLDPVHGTLRTWTLVTLQPQVNEQLKVWTDGQTLTAQGWLNSSGKWLRVQAVR